jgi:anti-anti-sigma factor
MSLPPKTSHHVVFPVELDRGVLIVAPRGDAVAFRDVDVHQELDTLMQALDDASVRHLIIDFGGANYYGSTIIGAVVGLARKVTESGGQAVFCSLSNDMANVLRVMHLDQLWPIFDSLKAAKAFVRKVSG